MGQERKAILRREIVLVYVFRVYVRVGSFLPAMPHPQVSNGNWPSIMLLLQP